jgi:hypothetical protein
VTGATVASSATAGNGLIDAAWNSTDASAESRLFWQHVRLAGLAAGPADLADPLFTPRNVMGGAVGVSSTVAAQLQVAGMSGQYQVCSSAIPGRFAKQLDIMLDDSDTARGSLRAVPDGSAPQAAAIGTGAIVDNDPYTVCMTF